MHLEKDIILCFRFDSFLGSPHHIIASTTVTTIIASHIYASLSKDVSKYHVKGHIGFENMELFFLP